MGFMNSSERTTRANKVNNILFRAIKNFFGALPLFGDIIVFFTFLLPTFTKVMLFANTKFKYLLILIFFVICYLAPYSLMFTNDFMAGNYADLGKAKMSESDKQIMLIIVIAIRFVLIAKCKNYFESEIEKSR